MCTTVYKMQTIQGDNKCKYYYGRELNNLTCSSYVVPGINSDSFALFIFAVLHSRQCKLMAHRDLKNPLCNIMLITMPVCNKQVHMADNEKTTSTKTSVYACAAV